jgi:hypothetical protein
MPRIGITGHTSLSDSTSNLVYHAMKRELGVYRPTELHGITCLAEGADQLFARAIADRGGTYEAILPAGDYRDNVIEKSRRVVFDELVSGAVAVSYMPFARSGRAAYMAASRELIRRSDLLFAVWDGSTSGRLGDTGHVVATARKHELSVRVVWPENAVRV